METLHKIGRRKTAVARVYLSEGKGNITINNKDLKDYFTTGTLQYKVNQPFSLTETTGTAEAIRLALSRALVEIDAENRLVLKPEGLMTRDPRMVERKKFGQKKARKKFQFSKR